MLGIERHGDADTGVVLDRRVVARGAVFVVFATGFAVGASLDDEFAFSGGDELNEDVGEVFGDLLEGSGDGFVLALVEDFDEGFDGVAGGVELAAALDELLAAFGEVFVLLEGFLVDVFELAEGFVDFFEFAGKLLWVSYRDRYGGGTGELTLSSDHLAYRR